MNGAVIPGYPYEGAFYWFIADDNVRRYGGTYYGTLYGPERERLAKHAAALACLFPEILLAPADAQLPETRGYRNSDLRLRKTRMSGRTSTKRLLGRLSRTEE
jgi:hypothetical protein